MSQNSGTNRHPNTHATGSRGFESDAPRRRHGSHRRPHGADKKRTDDLHEEATSSRHGSHRRPQNDVGRGTRGLNDDFNDSTGGKLDDSKDGVWPEGGLHPQKKHRPKEHGHKEHGHQENRHQENERGEHKHREDHHGKHHADERREDKLKKFNQKLYETALLPFHEKSGSKYECKQSEIDFHHQGVFAKPNKGPFVSAMQATQEVLRWNDEKRAPPREELDIIRNLTIAIHDAEKNLLFGPDLAIKAFADLDRVFFGGRLRGHVVVRWVDKLVSRKDEVLLGHAIFHQPGQCRIELSADKILLLRKWTKIGKNPVAYMFGVLLHEMCHAYACVRNPHERPPGDGHGEHFQTMIGVIHDRAIRILGTVAIFDWQTYKQQHFLPKEDEKDRKGGPRVRHNDGENRGGSERKYISTSTVDRQGWGSRKGTGCVVM